MLLKFFIHKLYWVTANEFLTLALNVVKEDSPILQDGYPLFRHQEQIRVLVRHEVMKGAFPFKYSLSLFFLPSLFLRFAYPNHTSLIFVSTTAPT